MIDLGGRSVELLDISAHSNGSLAFLDRKNGYLFVGGELESAQERVYAGDAMLEDNLNHIYTEAGDPEHKLCRVRWGKASFFVNRADMIARYGTSAL